MIVATVAYVAQSHHYDKRQAKNTDLPRTKQEAEDLNWKNSNKYDAKTNPNGGGPAASCHQYSAVNRDNIKYVSPNGHREVIFDSAGNTVLDPRDIGTYNICPSSELWYSKESLGHLAVDIIPWILFGNNDDDPGPIANWIIQLFE